ncbi:MAG: hypothetical protein QXV73_05760 [Candidatus Micrarchaeia archaeon]
MHCWTKQFSSSKGRPYIIVYYNAGGLRLKINADLFTTEFEKFFNFNLLKEYFSFTQHQDRLNYLINSNLISSQHTVIGYDSNNELAYVLMFPNLDRNFFNHNIMLVSHIDDVYEKNAKRMRKTKRNISIEQGQDGFILFSDYENGLGLGADDGLGVLSSIFIYHLFVKYDYEKTPIILICNYEESGGKGARRFCHDVMNGKLSEIITKNDVNKLTYMIELDRMGCKDCVFYNYEPHEFKEYIESFGFKEALGSFSDISVLGDYFNQCSVNLSIGYFNNHNSIKEFAYLACTKETLYKVINMIYDNNERKKIWVNYNNKKDFRIR